MKQYRETSQFSKGNIVWMGLSIVALLGWAWIEAKAYLDGRPSFLGIAYIGLFAGLIFWRYAVRYVYSLTDSEFIITSKVFYFSRTFIVPLNAVDSCSDKYVRSFLKRTGISRFVHRYSSGDGQETRMLVFIERGKPNAVLFKVSDNFMKQLKSLTPQIREERR